ncbi:MAG: hypothetical protein HY901_10400 [Deltaproteobacteria bacterium]|nr:hypothetical protein [Deltaproteobacteria bacterium]
MAQGRVSRLLSGSTTSLTQPDLYAFAGASIISIRGQSALLFDNKVPSADTVIAAALGADPQVTVGTFQVGLELRVKNRIGVGVFLETLPAVDSSSIGPYLDLAFIQFESVGAEVSFCF